MSTKTMRILLAGFLGGLFCSAAGAVTALQWDATMAASGAPAPIHANYREELCVNGAGLDVTGLLHRNNFSVNTWRVTKGTVTHPTGGIEGSAWLRLDFGAVYNLDSLWGWNMGLAGYTSEGIRKAHIQYSTDGSTWTEITGWVNGLTGQGEFAQSAGVDNYPHETEIDLGNVDARYILITAAKTDGNWGSTLLGIAELRFFVTRYSASEPDPAHLAPGAPTNAVLSWTPGDTATSHDVYLGTDPTAVANAGHGSPEFMGNQTEEYYPTSGTLALEAGQTYYWRVDEVDGGTYAGVVWQFTVIGTTIPQANIIATAPGAIDSAHTIINTINGSGLVDLKHSTNHLQMWYDNASGSSANHPFGLACKTWAKYELDRIYELGNLLIWNSNQSGYTNRGLRNVRVDYSVNGTNYTNMGSYEWPQADGHEGLPISAHVNFAGTQAKYVVITSLEAGGNWGGNYYGLSEVQFNLPVDKATVPYPRNDVANVPSSDVVLTWEPGIQGISRDVYFGTSLDDVSEEASPVSTGQTQLFYPTSGAMTLALDQTYYWRVDEFDGSAVTPGDIWQFTVEEYLTLEDFNDANDLDAWVCNRGAGYIFSEGEIAIDPNGLRLEYQNNVSPYVTEATMTYATAQDWSVKNGAALQLYVRGDATNATGHSPIYVTLTDDANPANSVTAYHPNADLCQAEEFVIWDLPLAQFSGVDLSQIKSITLGVGDGSNSGQEAGDRDKVYFESLMLWPPSCRPDLLVLPGDINQDCSVDIDDLVILCQEWLSDGISAIATGGITATSEPASWHVNYRAELAINGAGLDVTGLLHLNNYSINTWQTNAGLVTHHVGGTQGSAWIEVDLGTVYDLMEMWVWNLALAGTTGRGARNVTIEYSVDGTTWTTLAGWTNKLTGLAEIAQSAGVNNYPHETEIDFGGVAARFVVITVATTDGNWDNGAARGVAELKFFTVNFEADLNGDNAAGLPDFSVLGATWHPEPLLWPAP